MNYFCNFFQRFFVLCVIFATVQNATAEETPQTLCAAGYYVEKCGDYVIGTNLLKGYQIDDTHNSPDYYDYANENNLVNLRKFFAGVQPFRYRTKMTQTVVEIEPEEYVPFRNGLLASICNPAETEIICQKCPEDADVDESVVGLDADNVPVEDSWIFHTISDCYINEFSDSTGTFEYVDPETPDVAQNCYYNIEISGSTLVRPTAVINELIHQEMSAFNPTSD